MALGRAPPPAGAQMTPTPRSGRSRASAYNAARPPRCPSVSKLSRSRGCSIFSVSSSPKMYLIAAAAEPPPRGGAHRFSYDRPTCNYNVQVPFWLVSSGDLDRGRNNAVTFYQTSQALGVPMILKISNGLGHAHSPEFDELRDVFLFQRISFCVKKF